MYYAELDCNDYSIIALVCPNAANLAKNDVRSSV
uniref:Uncharacterized protein n=1 Tax=virus sp. ctML55 TaxID=2827627 RepID=A0A8S5RIQ7_9VIRU|nr:MAG TPA: hypothetical protein [virus sp. ctML55]